MMKLLVVLLLSSLSWAGRTFNGTTDYIDTGTYTLAGSAFNITAFTNTSNTNPPTEVAFAQYWNGTCGSSVFVLFVSGNNAQSQVADSNCVNVSIAAASANAWKELSEANPQNTGGGGCNIHGYYGTTDTTQNAAGACTINQLNHQVIIGATNDGTGAGPILFWVGKLANVAYWDFGSSTRYFTVIEYTALNRGQPASQIAGAKLTHYWPLHGLASPEPDIKGQKNGTLHGTTASFAPMNPEIPPIQGAY